MSNFSLYKHELSKSVTGSDVKMIAESDEIIVKADISGIQDFIFSIKSKGASRQLKARSFFVEVLSDICIEQIFTELNLNKSTDLILNAGGNFYFKCSSNALTQISAIEDKLNRLLINENIYIAFSYTGVNNKYVGEIFNELAKESAVKKLNKFKNSIAAFEPYNFNEVKLKWDELTSGIVAVKNVGYVLNFESEYSSLRVNDKGIRFGNVSLVFSSKKDTCHVLFENRMLNKIPLWNSQLMEIYKEMVFERISKNEIDSMPKDGDLVEFGFLSRFTEHLHGSDKLGVLKLDVDNLGNLFKSLKSIDQIQKVSSCISWFFSDHLVYLLNTDYEKTNLKYKNYIYSVFAGGDDCFLIGTWDVLLEFAILLKKEFDNFKPAIAGISISASYLTSSSSFPVIRLADMAEEFLKEAKYAKNSDGKLLKNNINIWGEILSWSGFEEAENLKDTLFDLIINKGESRSLIERVKNCKTDVNKIVLDASKGAMHFSQVWRLRYGFRNVKKVNRTIIEENVLKELEKSILNLFISKDKLEVSINVNKYPVAARWCELLTKK
jgi:CRISPR-associated protein Csm1